MKAVLNDLEDDRIKALPLPEADPYEGRLVRPPSKTPETSIDSLVQAVNVSKNRTERKRLLAEFNANSEMAWGELVYRDKKQKKIESEKSKAMYPKGAE